MPGLAACHCVELLFVFGAWEAWRAASMLAGIIEAEFRAISDDVMGRWFSFAVSGDPGFAAWRANALSVLHIDQKPTLLTK
jgi:carboxylesterase type B